MDTAGQQFAHIPMSPLGSPRDAVSETGLGSAVGPMPAVFPHFKMNIASQPRASCADGAHM